MTAETFARLSEVVRWRLVRWQWHPDWEDLCQEALIHAWEVIEQGKSAFQLNTVAGRAADYAVSDYLNSRKVFRREFRRARQTPDPPVISLDEMQAHALRGEPTGLPDQPDFSEALIRRCEQEKILADLKKVVREPQWDLIREVYLEEKGVTRYAQEHGITVSAVQQQLNRVLNAYRARLGIPLSCGRPGNWAGRKGPSAAERTACYHGHALTPENRRLRTGGHGKGTYACRICDREYRRRQREKALCCPSSPSSP